MTQRNGIPRPTRLRIIRAKSLPNTRSYDGTNRDRMEPKVPVVLAVEPGVDLLQRLEDSLRRAKVGQTTALTDEATPMHGTTRCSCAECLAERDTIRTAGLGQMRIQRTDDENDYWADVDWDDPVNRFRGASGGDGSSDEGGQY